MRETTSVIWIGAIDTESVSDSGSSNTVLAVTLALVVLGVALIGVTTWFWRATRPDPEALGPLLVMSDRDFARRGPIEQRRSLDAARPSATVVEEPIDEPLVGDGDEMPVPGDESSPPVSPAAEPVGSAERDDDWDDDWDEISDADEASVDAPAEDIDESSSPGSRPIDPLLG